MGRLLRLLPQSESVTELIWQRLWPPRLPPSLHRSRADPPGPQISQNVQADQRAAAPGLSPAGSPQKQGCQHMAFSPLFPHSQLPTLCRGRSICLLGSDVKMHLHPLPPLGQQWPLHAPLSFLRLFPHPFLPLSQTPSSHKGPQGTLEPSLLHQAALLSSLLIRNSIGSCVSTVAASPPIYRPGNTTCLRPWWSHSFRECFA